MKVNKRKKLLTLTDKSGMTLMDLTGDFDLTRFYG